MFAVFLQGFDFQAIGQRLYGIENRIIFWQQVAVVGYDFQINDSLTWGIKNNV